MNINYEQVVIEELSSFLKNIKNKELNINPTSKIIDDLDLDSLDLVEISIVASKKYGFGIDEEILFENQIVDVAQLIEIFKKMHNDPKI
jgi:acyl carrier protein